MEKILLSMAFPIIIGILVGLGTDSICLGFATTIYCWWYKPSLPLL